MLKIEKTGRKFASFAFFEYICSGMKQEAIKPHLIGQLKKVNAFWSYSQDSIKDVPDDILVELVMLHIDLDDIDMLFQLYPFPFVKKAWIENVVAQGERYYVLNRFFAWFYFGIKKPGAYVKAMATRQLNKKMAA